MISPVCSCSPRFVLWRVRRRVLRALLVFLLLAPTPFTLPSTYAAPQHQDDDPATQCADGLQLFNNGKSAEALPLLEAGFTNREKAHFAHPNDLGACALALGTVYIALDKPAEALEASLVALQVFRDIDDREFQGVALVNIGSAYANQGRYGQALESYQQALAIEEEIGDREYRGTTLGVIGGVHANQGRYGQALEYYQQALAIRREFNDRLGESVSLNNIGIVYDNQGRYGEALASFQQALAIVREVSDRLAEGITLNNIGAVYASQGRYVEALESYQQALAIAREVGDRRNEGITLSNIGTVFDDQGRYAEALESYQQALVIMREVSNRRGEGIVLSNIGMAYTGEGRYAEALESLQLALAINREIGDRRSEGLTLNNIGGVYTRQEQFIEALKSYQQALAIEEEIGDRRGEGTTLENIGKVYADQGRHLEALDYDEQAMAVYETLRAVAGGESARISFIAQYANLYDRTVELYYQQNRPDKAFFTTERGRARSFLDSIATGYVELSDNTAAALYTQEREAYAARQAAQDVLAKAKAQIPPDDQLINDLEVQLIQAETDYQTALGAIADHGGQLAQLVPGRSTVLDLPQAQALLDDRTTLLSFWVLDEQTLAFVLTQTRFNAIALSITRKDLYTQIAAFRDFANTDTSHPESAVALYRALIEPLKPYLSTSHLVIVPHGELHYLPFAALTDGTRYMIDDYTLAYLPSVSAWPHIQQNTGHANANPLILGNPATDNADLKPLPHAESEAQAIAELYQIAPLLGSNATESALRVQVEQAGVLHLAVHGSYNSNNPLYSTLYMAPDAENDGLLETHEIYGLKLSNTDLVVLSACQTQLGQLSSGDELVGLTRAFFFAGTPSVLASLWSVDDRATQLLIETFYTHWRQGMGKARALQQAQIEVRAEYPNPYYWAAFVLSGDEGESTAVRPRPPVPLPTPGWGLVLVLLAGLCTCVISGGGVAAIVIIVRRAKKR